MNRLASDRKLLERVTCGDAEATDFLVNNWSPYVHAIDDIIDGERTDAEHVLATFARAAFLYTHPFFVKHCAALRQLAVNISIAYSDSVAWEKSAEAWQRQWADHYRHSAMEMVVAVASICGGYEHARAIASEQRCICHFDHHDRAGMPV